jgi:hypothetical protein
MSARHTPARTARKGAGAAAAEVTLDLRQTQPKSPRFPQPADIVAR